MEKESLIVKSKVREYLKEKGMQTGSGVVDGDTLNDRIREILDRAIKRTKANKRKTVQAKDI